MSAHKFSVRALDLGYGHVKFTDGRSEDGAVRCDSFPSQSPAAMENTLDGAVVQRRDTHIVRVSNHLYEVGRAVALASGANHESEVLDQDFALGDPYAARLYGALSYMAGGLPAHTLDFLVLGLPLNTFHTHSEAVSKKFSGDLLINANGDRLIVRECCVYPQPLGAYMAFMTEQPVESRTRAPMALVVDPGYNTVDWFVVQGMSASESRSNATLRGVSAVLRAIAQKITKSVRGATVTEVVRRLDESLTTGLPFTMYGKPIDLDKFMPAGTVVIEEAVQAIKNSVGSGVDIDVIVLAGGGAKLYAKALAAKFPQHKLVTLENPAFANVRGFQYIGERLAASAARAAGNAA